MRRKGDEPLLAASLPKQSVHLSFISSPARCWKPRKKEESPRDVEGRVVKKVGMPELEGLLLYSGLGRMEN